jgi:hypothetical protein
MLGGISGAIPTGSGASLLSGGLVGSGSGGSGSSFSGMPSTASFLAMQNNLNGISSSQGGGRGALSAASLGAPNN